jgi:F-type H+-transporting ATPase subunit delta
MTMSEQVATHAVIPTVMDNPQVGAVAKVYAKSLLDAVPADKQVAVLEEFGSLVQDVLPANPEFARLLSSAVVGKDDKLKLIDNVLGGRANPLFVNFLRVLARHERLDLLAPIHRQAVLQHELRAGKQRVQVTVAREVSPETRRAIEESLAKVLPFTPIVELTVDPELLGGMKIRVEDTVYDGSLRTRLKQLRQQVQQRSTHEIQSGRDRFSHLERD